MSEGQTHSGVDTAAEQRIEAAQGERLRRPQQHPAFAGLGVRQPDLLGGNRAGGAE